MLQGDDWSQHRGVIFRNSLILNVINGREKKPRYFQWMPAVWNTQQAYCPLIWDTILKTRVIFFPIFMHHISLWHFYPHAILSKEVAPNLWSAIVTTKYAKREVAKCETHRLAIQHVHMNPMLILSVKMTQRKGGRNNTLSSTDLTKTSRLN